MSLIDLKENVIKNVRAVVWKRDGGNVLFLLTQELSGYFTLPGGCKDLEDADLRSALSRELSEELGLNPGDYSVADTDIRREYENLYSNPKSERFGKTTIVNLFIVSKLSKEPMPNNEIKNVAWFSREKALEALNSPHMKELFGLGVQFVAQR